MTPPSASGRRSQNAAAAGKRRTRPSGDHANPSRAADPAASRSPDVAHALGEAAARIRPFPVAWQLWQRLTVGERRQLGGDFEAAFAEQGTVGIWRGARGGTPVSALLDAAREIGFLTSADFAWLSRETSPQTAPSGPSSTPGVDKPVWQRETGILLWQNRELAHFRRNREPTLIEQILTAFDKAAWAKIIAHPFTGLPREKLSQAIYHLNNKLKRLCVRLDGRFLSWEINQE